MPATKVHFLSLGESLAFEVSSEQAENIERFMFDAFGPFIQERGKDKPALEALQRNTPEVRKHFDELSDGLKVQIPSIQKIPAFFRKLKENEYFFALPGVEIKPEGYLNLRLYMEALSEGRSFEEAKAPMDELFKDFLGQYSMSTYGNALRRIGNPIKTDRLCRFCARKQPVVTFDQAAHAISESLGNKTLYLHDECDECNGRFSRDVEQDTIEYFSLYIGLFGVKGKSGNRTAKGKDYKLTHGTHPEIILDEGAELPVIRDGSFSIVLKGKVPVSLNAVYRCLSKYFLSVIPESEMPHFARTMEWVNTGKAPGPLPVVSELISYHAFSLQPQLVVYLRKSDDTSMPYAVGEFKLTCTTTVFVLPFSDEDDRYFDNKKDFEHFWRTFKHYNTGDWLRIDCSSDKRVPINRHLNMTFETMDPNKE